MFDYRFMRHTGQSIAAGRRNSLMFGALQSLSLPDEAGQIDIAALQLGTDGPKVVRLQSSGHQVDLTEDNCTTLLLPRRGRLSSRLGDAQWHAAQSNGLLFGPTTRSTQVIGPFDAFALVFPHEALLRALAGSVRLPDGLNFRAEAPGLARMFRLLADIHDLTGDNDAGLPPAKAAQGLAAMTSDGLVDLILGQTEGDLPDRQPRSHRHRVLLAEEIMRTRAAEPLSMAEIARNLGISLRSLQLAFQQVRHMGPRDALNRIRLDMAHHRLLCAQHGDTVTSIALDCGVSHVSRFAAAYRQSFGEYPAETLSEALRRSA
ncbi:helix-turn-helix transcriptional regulator [Neogemmobacter tilapiae]|uniref:AraC family transcriptional regulator n=1 Tax=Neogemmobacter tilapiae TaxID=875041 RepID=A0A918TJT2_9RHOB|nr:helix-turn-helix domain-containing protein [Gemmobacter tilapiae]GHC48129.1 AraC family transcriptional regulator [Gemmobacter tilapiae]